MVSPVIEVPFASLVVFSLLWLSANTAIMVGVAAGLLALIVIGLVVNLVAGASLLTIMRRAPLRRPRDFADPMDGLMHAARSARDMLLHAALRSHAAEAEIAAAIAAAGPARAQSASVAFLSRDHGAAGGVTVGEDVPTCPICLEALEPGQRPHVRLACNHHFHYVCAEQWFDPAAHAVRACPLCRAPTSCAAARRACEAARSQDTDPAGLHGVDTGAPVDDSDEAYGGASGDEAPMAAPRVPFNTRRAHMISAILHGVNASMREMSRGAARPHAL